MHTCKNCTHWKKVEGDARTVGIAVNVGECRANPPTISHNWPRTRGNEHCSCHSAHSARYAGAQPPLDKPHRKPAAKPQELPLR